MAGEKHKDEGLLRGDQRKALISQLRMDGLTREKARQVIRDLALQIGDLKEFDEVWPLYANTHDHDAREDGELDDELPMPCMRVCSGNVAELAYASQRAQGYTPVQA